MQENEIRILIQMTFFSTANLKKILNKFIIANGDKDIISRALEQLQPLITAANIGNFDS